MKSTKNSDTSPIRQGLPPKPGKSIDPKERKPVGVFNFMSNRQGSDKGLKKPIEVARVSFPRDLSAGPMQEREKNSNSVKRFGRNSIVFPFTSKSKSKMKSLAQSTPNNSHIEEMKQQQLSDPQTQQNSKGQVEVLATNGSS